MNHGNGIEFDLKKKKMEDLHQFLASSNLPLLFTLAKDDAGRNQVNGLNIERRRIRC